MGELFAADVKGVASAIAVMFNWTLVFIITKTFGMMVDAWGSGKSTLIFTQLSISNDVLQVQPSTSSPVSWSSAQSSCLSKFQRPKANQMLRSKPFSLERTKTLHREVTQTQHSQNEFIITHRTQPNFYCKSFLKRFFDVKSSLRRWSSRFEMDTLSFFCCN
jgi:hypothetical protein